MKRNSVMTFSALIVALGGYSRQASAQYDTKPKTDEKTEMKRQGAAKTELSTADQGFVTEAARILAEGIAVADAASARVRDERIKKLTQDVKKSHEKAQRELSAFAGKYPGATVAKKLTEEQRKTVEEFKKLEAGRAHERFLTYVRQSHTEAIDLFDRQTKSAENDELRRWASETVRTLRQHLEEAERMAPPTT